jgi:hypothetical protein
MIYMEGVKCNEKVGQLFGELAVPVLEPGVFEGFLVDAGCGSRRQGLAGRRRKTQKRKEKKNQGKFFHHRFFTREKESMKAEV